MKQQTSILQQKSPTQPGHLPELHELLTTGGDHRIAINPETGHNRYYCLPYPDPSLATFGSTTASGISWNSHQKLEQLRNNLLHRINFDPPDLIYRQEMNRIRNSLLELCGFHGKNRPAVIFSASGTDLHFIAASLNRQNDRLLPVVIMVAPSESGSGVPDALKGHWPVGNRTPNPPLFTEISANLENKPDILSVHLRLNDGSLRHSREIDHEFEFLAKKWASQGRRVLIVMTDVSKTGCLAPSPACALSLFQKFPENITILVDACQFRISPETLKTYINSGFMVALTGSKFLSGPAFSGALLLPSQLDSCYRNLPMPPELKSSYNQGEWPLDWPENSTLLPISNFGLLFRWEAALEEWKGFLALPSPSITKFLLQFKHALLERLDLDPVFRPLPVPEINRNHQLSTQNWDSIQTIFPFQLLQAKSGHKLLNQSQTLQIYQQMQSSYSLQNPSSDAQKGLSPVSSPIRYQLGQPVSWGTNPDDCPGALRLSLSTRLIVEAIQNKDDKSGIVIKRALDALNKAAELIHAL